MRSDKQTGLIHLMLLAGICFGLAACSEREPDSEPAALQSATQSRLPVRVSYVQMVQHHCLD